MKMATYTIKRAGTARAIARIKVDENMPDYEPVIKDIIAYGLRGLMEKGPHDLIAVNEKGEEVS